MTTGIKEVSWVPIRQIFCSTGIKVDEGAAFIKSPHSLRKRGAVTRPAGS